MRVVFQRFLPLGAQSVGRLAGLVEEPLAFGLRLVRRLAQEGGALLVELLVFCAGTLSCSFWASAFLAAASASSVAINFSARRWH